MAAVGREVSFWGSALTINNLVGGDVTATVGDPTSTGVTELRTLFDFLAGTRSHWSIPACASARTA